MQFLLQKRRSVADTTLLSLTILLSLTAVLYCQLSYPKEQITVSHGLALHGELKYPVNFKHFDYVNPTAPKAGEIKLMGHGNFDSLNYYTLKGISPMNTPGFFQYGINELNETLLMGTSETNRVGDEPQSAYGLLAETIEYPDDFRWIIFNLNPKARFHDNNSVTAADVVFSYNTLIKHGHPRYQAVYQDIKSATVIAPRKVKFTLGGTNRKSLALRVGELPVFSKKYWQGKDFKQASLTPPLNSGPYRITDVKAGHYLIFERVANYWGKDLPVNRGRYNFDKIKVEFYRDLTVAFEAFKAGRYDLYFESIAKNWTQGYDFQAVQSGSIIKAKIPHQRPAGLQAFFFNTRRPFFQDVRVRQAISMVFDFEWINKQYFYSAYKRTNSYFANTDLASQPLPSIAEKQLLSQYSGLDKKILTSPFTLSKTQGTGHNRKQQRQAIKLLKQAGWQLQQGKLISPNNREPLQFEALARNRGLLKVWEAFQKNLKRIGIQMSIRLVDSAEFKRRLDQFDFDMTSLAFTQSLAPNQSLRDLFQSQFANTEGTLNFSGIKNPIVDDLVEKVITAKTRPELRLYTQALDRVLLWQHYIIPNWYTDHYRVAYWNKFNKPTTQPPYYFGLENWWFKTDR
ncbi:extracellular solute-binding protein [Spartinivicinus poritis]|uniref:Extracellular solute-binding protein n=1 Tax=Spartinivicinus poritis TaxID=2994640 RepID=A0ABT5U6J7_9GAMM|nr:extracellular solute-binding protein [Spartinivicinus sp. A2-2]MDE1461083.1 extracellular solute-binding protein [Spartinivicinus sp. A2-2]